MGDGLEVVVVGGGHAGLLASRQLQRHGVEHVVVEQGRVGESWRSQRWDSFAMNTPTWMTRLPDDGEDDQPQDGFLLRDQWVTRLADWAARHRLPVRGGRARHGPPAGPVRRSVRGRHRDPGPGHARACRHRRPGMQRVPRIPAAAAAVPDGVVALHAADYRRPAELPPGGVLVVGCAQTGGRIAEERFADDRRVTVAASAVARQRRRYGVATPSSGCASPGCSTSRWSRCRFRRCGSGHRPSSPAWVATGTLSLQGLRGVAPGWPVGSPARRRPRMLFADDLAASIRRGDRVGRPVRHV
ncbi:MAG: FAD-dependent monooxygenase [Chloroflexota bacterium]